jgi:HSP20 family protein
MVMERWRPGRGLIPWRPFREVEEMQRHFEDLFGRPFLPAMWRRIPTMEMGWAPAIEVFEKEDKFVVKAELPGMKEDDIDISVVGDTLTIKGERKAESEVKEEDYYCCERSYGSFSRSIAMPSNVDAKKIEASYEDGVLEVSLPKAPEVKPKKISVSAKKKEKTSK